MVDEQQVRRILQTVKHPKVQKSFLDLGLIRNIGVDGDTVSLTLALKSENSPLRKGLEKQIDSVLRSLPGVSHVHMEVTALNPEEWEKIFPPPAYQGIARVKQIVAVASGKGRGRQNHGGGQYRPGPGRSGPAGRPDGCRYLRAVNPDYA